MTNYYTYLPLASLSAAELLIAADTMDELYMKTGDNIVQQDDIGDSFYVLEEGTVIVTVSSMYIYNYIESGG